MSIQTVKNTLQLTALGFISWMLILVADATAIETGQPLLQDQLKGAGAGAYNMVALSIQGSINSAIVSIWPYRGMIVLFVLLAAGSGVWWLTSAADTSAAVTGWTASKAKRVYQAVHSRG